MVATGITTLSNPSPGIQRQLVTAVSTIDHPHRCQSPTPPPTMATHRSHPLRDSRRDRQIQQGGFPPIFFPQKGSRCSPVMEGAPAPDGHSANDVHPPHLPIAYSTKVAPFEREGARERERTEVARVLSGRARCTGPRGCPMPQKLVQPAAQHMHVAVGTRCGRGESWALASSQRGPTFAATLHGRPRARLRGEHGVENRRDSCTILARSKVAPNYNIRHREVNCN